MAAVIVSNFVIEYRARVEYLVVPAVALVISGITLLSGFGLGTVLMPTLALFFPAPAAPACSRCSRPCRRWLSTTSAAGGLRSPH
jgi:hypothetical protein